jgi:integrase
VRPVIRISCDAGSRAVVTRTELETLERFKRRPLLRHDQATRDRSCVWSVAPPGHERAARTRGLCTDCCRHRAARRQTVEEFVAGHERFGVPKPRPSFGRCLVDDCRRWATNDRGFCQVCYRRWKKIPVAKRAAARERFLAAGPWQPPRDGWRAAMPAVPELVEWQLLAGLQLLIDPYGVTMALDRPAMAWAHVARTRVGSVRDLGELPGTYPSQRALEIAMIAARRLTTTPEEERVKDVWDLGVFGLGEKRAIDFTRLHQRWLRDAAKGYTIERLANRKTRTAQQDVVWLAYLSDYLRGRSDGGERPGALTREDMTGFLSWLRVRMPVTSRRALVISATRRHVQFARRHLEPSTSAAGRVGGSFQLYSEDLPGRTMRDPDEPGRALPPVVLAQLLDEEVLAPLGSKHLEYRIGFELIAHSGRRPGEICNLAADCLRFEEEPAPGGGKQHRPVLRYLREKPPSKWLSLPINQDAADLIEAQQLRLQARFPGTKLGKLALLPRRKCNPTGRLPVISPTLSNRVSKWIKSIPALLDENGNAFPSESVYLYALRHSYAQRHADAGVPLDTLQKLMDHRTAATTQIYYRVTSARKREAIEPLAPLTMDKEGRRVGSHASLLESERLREEIGRIPVPLGYCTEQHNVKALGAHCPFSHQCLGCEHFRTDPSHLPDLYAYLERLLETRERLRAAVPQLAEWARTKAIPADAEIRTVRTLIGASEDALEELAPGERSKLLGLFRVLRATRARMDGTIGIDHVGATRNPEPTFTPPAFTPLPSVRATSKAGRAPDDRPRGKHEDGQTPDQHREARTGPIRHRANQRPGSRGPAQSDGHRTPRRSTPLVREQPLRRATRARQGRDPVAVHRRAERPDRAERSVAQGRDGNRQVPSPRSATTDPRPEGAPGANPRQGGRRQAPGAQRPRCDPQRPRRPGRATARRARRSAPADAQHRGRT